MRLLYIGDFSDHFDEGLKNIAKTTYSIMSKYHEIDKLNIKELFNKGILKTLNSDYDIIHYFTAPTFSSFVILKLFKLTNRKSKTVISALHPKAEEYLRSKVKRQIISSLLKVDAILYQYNPRLYEGLAKKIFFFPNGVDTNRFSPVPSQERKIKLRKELGLPENKFIILHVGHLSTKRNIGIFEKIQKSSSDIQVVIAGSTYLEKDLKLYTKLKNAGCIIFTGYVPHIERLYKASDLYVFPVPWKNSINIPLTVLEAMSTNLPVVSLKYPGLSPLGEVTGLYFTNSEDELINIVLRIKEKLESNKLDVKTRNAILKWSWENLASILNKYYEEIVGEDRNEKS